MKSILDVNTPAPSPGSAVSILTIFVWHADGGWRFSVFAEPFETTQQTWRPKHSHACCKRRAISLRDHSDSFTPSRGKLPYRLWCRSSFRRPRSQNSLCRGVCMFVFNHSPTRIYALRLVVSPGSLSEKKQFLILTFFFTFILFHKTDFLKSPGWLSCKMSNFLDLSYYLLSCVLSVDWKLSLRLMRSGCYYIWPGYLLSNAVCHVASPPEADGIHWSAVSEADFGHLAKIVTHSRDSFPFAINTKPLESYGDILCMSSSAVTFILVFQNLLQLVV